MTGNRPTELSWTGRWLLTCLAGLWLVSPSLAQTEEKPPQESEDKVQVDDRMPPVRWQGAAQGLFPAQGMGDWQPISFGGEGDCFLDEGLLTIESGDPMTGVILPRKDLPTHNYELQLEARRTEGIDFFCGLTFPVNDSHCCLIVGGWAGAVVGLSNLDDKDASSNDSRQLMTFADQRWYKIRIRVYEDRIAVWIDDRCVINQDIRDKKISLRGDTLSCRPLGLCTFQTTSETRKLTLRKFVPGAAPADNGSAGGHR